MVKRSFVVSCFSSESRTLELEGAVSALTAADAAIEFFRRNGLGRPSLPLRIELPEINADSVIQVWSVSIPGIGLHIRIKERIREEFEEDKSVNDCGDLLN